MSFSQSTLSIPFSFIRFTPWTGLPGLLFDGPVYISWDGYLKVPQTGLWTFELETTSYMRVFIENQLAIQYIDCAKEKIIRRQSILLNSTGLMSIHVDWYLHSGDYCAILRWAAPGEEVAEVIPATAFVYAPETQLQFSTMEAVLPLNRRIQPIKSIVFATRLTPTYYQVNPSLPPGLSLSDGTIMGTPTEIMPKTMFTIIGIQGSVKIQGTIYLTIHFVQSPTQVKLLQNEHEIQELHVMLYQVIDDITIQSDGRNVLFTVSPSLPAGFEFKQPVISGRGTERVETSIRLTVTAQNEGGEVSIVFFMSIRGCQYGDTFYTYMTGSSMISLYYMHHGEVIDYVKRLEAYDYGYIMCPQSDDYQVNVYCMSIRGCRYRVYREDYAVMWDARIDSKSWYNQTLIRKASIPPSLHVHTSVYTTKRLGKVFFSYTAEGVYRPITFTPSPPDTLIVDDLEGTITGVITHQGVFSLTLVLANEVGSVNETIQLNIGECEEGEEYVLFSRGNMLNSEAYTIYQNEKEVMSENVIGGSLRYFCMNYQPYSIVLEGQSAWNSFDPLLLKSSGDILGSVFMIESTNQTVSFGLSNLLSRKTPTLYWHNAKSPKKGWKNLKYSDRGWILDLHQIGVLLTRKSRQPISVYSSK